MIAKVIFDKILTKNWEFHFPWIFLNPCFFYRARVFGIFFLFWIIWLKWLKFRWAGSWYFSKCFALGYIIFRKCSMGNILFGFLMASFIFFRNKYILCFFRGASYTPTLPPFTPLYSYLVFCSKFVGFFDRNKHKMFENGEWLIKKLTVWNSVSKIIF